MNIKEDIKAILGQYFDEVFCETPAEEIVEYVEELIKHNLDMNKEFLIPKAELDYLLKNNEKEMSPACLYKVGTVPHEHLYYKCIVVEDNEDDK